MSAFLLTVSLLFLQISGLHLHVSAEAVEGVHGAHGSHGSHHDSHRLSVDMSGPVGGDTHNDHADESDLSLFELGGSTAKVLSFLILLVACLMAIMLSGRLVFTSRLQSLNPRFNFRWRPPLRGPPVPVI